VPVSPQSGVFADSADQEGFDRRAGAAEPGRKAGQRGHEADAGEGRAGEKEDADQQGQENRLTGGSRADHNWNPGWNAEYFDGILTLAEGGFDDEIAEMLFDPDA
jgi:hypothetical protein